MNKEEIKKLLQKLGLDTVGIAPIGPYEELRKILQDKADKNLITGMEEADIEKRINPKLIMEDAKSIIVCAFPYYISEQYQSNISRYCYGQDYHLVIKNKLNNICEEIKSKDNNFKYEVMPAYDNLKLDIRMDSKIRIRIFDIIKIVFIFGNETY